MEELGSSLLLPSRGGLASDPQRRPMGPRQGPRKQRPGEGTTPLGQVQKCDLGLRRAQALEG